MHGSFCNIIFFKKLQIDSTANHLIIIILLPCRIRESYEDGTYKVLDPFLEDGKFYKAKREKLLEEVIIYFIM